MCGIVGIVARNARLNPAVLDRATQSLAHRGPDDSGTVILRPDSPMPIEVGLGNRRLAILDLSAHGHQPMQDAETGNWIVYNGELYNQQELRTRLIAEGAKFSGTSDTEVLVKAYSRWGEACVAQLRGMFAFAIWDASRRRLFLARDQMGIKPLYYGQFGSYFVFSSELRTLIDFGLFPIRLNRSAVHTYLSFGSVYEPLTMVEGMSVLPPGHSLAFQDGEYTVSSYWDLAAFSRNVAVSDSKLAIEEMHSTLHEAICMQMASDVGVGLFLSGGIDSGSLAAILNSYGFPLSTFSIVFKEEDYSEAEHSRGIAKKFKTEHHEILISEHDALAAIPALLRAMDQPTIDGLNTFLISGSVRDAGVKVALSGLGGDEMFAGYSTFRAVPRAMRFLRMLRFVPGGVRKVAFQAFLRWKKSDQSRKLAALLQEQREMIHPYFLSRALFTATDRRAIFPGTGEEEARARACLLDDLEESDRMDPITQVSYLETRCYMLNTLLRDADVMSMAHGLEVRVPLVDHKLAEKLFALPGALRMSKTVPKTLLVGATHGQLPDTIVHRRKRGFTLPFEHWLRGQLCAEIQKTLEGKHAGALENVLNQQAVRNVWRDFLAHRTSWSRPWSLYVLARWCEAHGISG